MGESNVFSLFTSGGGGGVSPAGGGGGGSVQLAGGGGVSQDRTYYMAGGMPLAFTQEDFLVFTV